ncbi:MAG: DedA family protein [Halobacteriovoraceae bacterium]|jgi:membrane-associated protein|nr:DedA family protein [Halobacteriovoraceae bacterium]MBT5094960.1 DedA family protein [Halobacteriovoraceae bacterium]
MQSLLTSFQEMATQNIELAPWLIFGLLILAGFNLPVSEDFMLMVSGILAAQNPEHMWPLFIAVFMGAYLSDLICFAFMGRYLGTKIFKIPFFAKMVNQERIDTLSNYYQKYGIFTLILGRFIPFGVRNGLFFTAGLGRMNPLKFALSDLLACVISCSAFFYLYYSKGQEFLSLVQKGNKVVIVVVIAALLIFVIYKKLKQRKQIKG